ncbi:MAG: YebC/PmpR family DNA-binding transcriptional regulator [Dehalococcoidia bacterium]|nr:YebC/PmpR family DNA-binding transcriptional regulator [Dehalococcoidia bacterium]
MSGHSKWSQIKRQKGVADDRRGQLFTKLGREITVAARGGGPDPAASPRLRLAIDRAREANMPKDNIERAIKRATGDGDAAALEEIVYEGYGPGGTAILIEALTDNRNRTVSDIRNAFARGGGNLGEAGSVGWLFETRGLITLETNGADAEEVALRAMDTGADDVNVDGASVEVYTRPDALDQVRRQLVDANIPVAAAEITSLPKSTVPLDPRKAEQVLRLLDRLDELDDVQRVSSNADFPEEVLAAYA